ncbi:MAG: hypothetical protein ABL977_01430 [Candidatus Eisenbacteria bacterium]
MNPTATTLSTPAADSNLLLAGAQRAARLASSLAEVATQWAESAHAGLDAARDARDAAVLAECMVSHARPGSTEDAARLLAADAWEAVQRALDATQRVTRAVAASSR